MPLRPSHLPEPHVVRQDAPVPVELLQAHDALVAELHALALVGPQPLGEDGRNEDRLLGVGLDGGCRAARNTNEVEWKGNHKS